MPDTRAVKVQAVAAQGAAAPGNNSNANILVVVTDLKTGAGVAKLAQKDFTIVNHFGVPGQTCGFTNNITSFADAGNGAYRINVATHSTNPPPGGCKWAEGHYLGQVLVRNKKVEGQAAFRLPIYPSTKVNIS